MLPPEQRGVFTVNVAVGIADTVTLADATFVQPAELVIVTWYTPDLFTAGLFIDGLCREELNPKGPDQKYEQPVKLLEPESERPCVSQMVLPVAESGGVGFTSTVPEVAAVQEFAAVTVRL